MFYNACLIVMGNDPGPQSTELLTLGTLLIIISALMNANIFGTISNVYNQMNIKEMRV